MVVVREFDNGAMYGLCEVQPEQCSDSEESDSHTIDNAEDIYGYFVTPSDTESDYEVEEVEPQLSKEVEIPVVREEQPQKGGDLHKPEDQDQHPPSMLLERLISCDPQPLQDEAEAEGSLSGELQNSESDRNQSSESSDHGLAVVLAPQLSSWEVLPPGSKAKGVCYHKNNKQWEAHLWIQGRQLRNRKKKGVQIFVGNYSTEDEAKHAHDRAAIKFGVRTSGLSHKPYPLNFHESAQADFIAEHQDWSQRDFLWKLRRDSLKFSLGKSNMKGVTVRENSRKRKRITQLGEGGSEAEPVSGETTVSMSSTVRYEAKIAKTDGRKMTCVIGTYGSEEEAGKAYDRALLFLNKDKEEVELWHVITNFRPSNYTAEEVLEAGGKLVFN